MGNINPSRSAVSAYGGEEAQLVTWANVAPGDVCVPVKLPEFDPVAFQAEGTIGGATVTLAGSLDGSNYHTLNDKTGAAISLTAAGMKSVEDHPMYCQPVLTNGTGSSMTFSLLMVRRATHVRG